MVTLGGIDPGFGPGDDRRHWPATADGRMRDSLFWELIMPEEKLGLQIYLYVSNRGRAGYNVSVWGPQAEPVALQLAQGTVGDDVDFDDFEFQGLRVRQPELRRAMRRRDERCDTGRHCLGDERDAPRERRRAVVEPRQHMAMNVHRLGNAKPLQARRLLGRQ